MRTIDGVVTILQESRFQLVDEAGAGHTMVLDSGSSAEPDQLERLAATQARVQVRYSECADVIGLLAHDVAAL